MRAGIYILSVLLILLTGCTRHELPASCQLQRDAWQAMQDYHSKTALRDPVIPREFWPESFDSLGPMDVYMLLGSVAIAQERTDSTETGIYIYIPTSSYWPVDGDRGISFQPISRDVWRYSKGRQ